MRFNSKLFFLSLKSLIYVAVLFFFFFIQIRNSAICILVLSTVRMNVCMYLHMCGSIQGKKKNIHPFIFFSFSPSAITPLALLIKTLKPFHPLNDILK